MKLVGVGDMTKILYHNMSNFISRLQYISQYTVVSFAFLIFDTI